MSLDFVDAIKSLIWHEVSGKMHTALPGIVEEYDHLESRVRATPVVHKRFKEGGVVEYPPIVSVPVIFPRTKRFRMTFPLEQGDGVLLVFSERSIENWVRSGRASAPSDTRKFSITDAMAIPGLFAFGFGLKPEKKDNVEFVFDNTKFISDGENFEFEAKKFKMKGDIELDGDIEAKEVTAKTLAGRIILSSHIHPPGGPPTPVP